MANYYTRGSFTGLGTFDFQVPTTGNWEILGKLTLPDLREGASDNSQVVVTISINGGGAVYTGLPGADGFRYQSGLTALDIIHVTLSSAATIDQDKNVVKMTTNLVEI